MNLPLFILLLVLLALLALVSYVDRLHAEMGKFLSREFQENIDAYEEQVEPRLHVSRERAALSMAVLTQICMASIGVLIGYVLFMEKRWVVLDLVQAAVSLIFIIVIFNRLLPYVFFVRTRGEWLGHWVPVLRALIYLALPVTLILGFALSVTSLSKEHAEKEPEHPSEAVDALIEAGQEEGILEESDRDLIQSVVEFGDKTVREVMTPRPEIVAVPATMTIAEFTELVKKYPYSRIPVYEGDIDHIKGIVYAKDLLQVPDVEAHTQDGSRPDEDRRVLRSRNQAGQRTAARDAARQHPHGDRDRRIRRRRRPGHDRRPGRRDRRRNSRRAREGRDREGERHLLHLQRQHRCRPAGEAAGRAAG